MVSVKMLLKCSSVVLVLFLCNWFGFNDFLQGIGKITIRQSLLFWFRVAIRYGTFFCITFWRRHVLLTAGFENRVRATCLVLRLALDILVPGLLSSTPSYTGNPTHTLENTAKPEI